jgi:hypothetical protein
VFPPLAEHVRSVEDGLQLIWNLPQVSSVFERIWALPGPPLAR